MKVDKPEPGAVGRPRGRYKSRLDEKGRLKLPADFQEYLKALGAGRVFITTLGDRVAKIYPEWVWDQVESALGKPSDNGTQLKAVLFTAHDYGGTAEMDGQGRLTFPAELRQELGLENSVVHLFWMGEHVDVMSDAEYAGRKAKHSESLSRGLELVDTMGLP